MFVLASPTLSPSAGPKVFVSMRLSQVEKMTSPGSNVVLAVASANALPPQGSSTLLAFDARGWGGGPWGWAFCNETLRDPGAPPKSLARGEVFWGVPQA